MAIKRLYAVTNSFSGVVGEMAVATALIRAGLRVAKPYWNDDEVDLLVFWEEGSTLVPMPVQVKSIQKLGSQDDWKSIQGLKKKYLEHNPWLSLGIYSPEHDKIWLICGSEQVKNEHAIGVAASKGTRGRPRTEYSNIDVEGDIPIYVNLSKGGDPTFDAKWLVDRTYPKPLTDQIKAHAERIQKSGELTALIKAVMNWSSP